MNDGWSPRSHAAFMAMFGALGALLTATPRAAVLAAEFEDRPACVLFSEGVDDARLLDRGWYDGEKFNIARDGARAGSGCIAFHWNKDKSPGFSGSRRQFEPSETIYLRCYMKLSRGWGWTEKPYHPHSMHFMTTENDKWRGPAASRLTVYIEPWNGKLRLAAQDIQNAGAPHGLTQGPLRGGYNGTTYDSQQTLFADDEWHCVEAMFQLNSLDLERDKPNADGVVRAWFDDKLVIDQTKVVLRSTDFPHMKFNQFLLAPYFGPGVLPHEQTLWIDELVVSKNRVGQL